MMRGRSVTIFVHATAAEEGSRLRKAKHTSRSMSN